MAKAAPAGPGREAPLQGREVERAQLEEGLAKARAGSGSAWVLQGPAGMGKTRLLHWLEHRGEELGFRTVWAYALQDIPSPFFLFDQAFSRIPREREATPSTPTTELPALLLVASDRPDDLLARAERLDPGCHCLLIAREMPTRVVSKHPGLPKDRRVLWLTRSEGADHLGPGDLDRVGETIVDHLRTSPSSVAFLTGLEYLVSQSSFPPVLKLVQYLRDEAEATQGHVLLGVAPSTLAPRELALLSAEGESEQLTATASATSVEPTPTPEEPYSARLLRYAEVLERVPKDRPLLMLLDDLQWADPQSLTAFQFLVRGISHVPVVIASTLREEGPQGMPPELAGILDGLDRTGVLHRTVLGPLTSQESDRLATSFLPGPLRPHDQEAWVRLVGRAGGNPYFVLETARFLLQEGLVHLSPAGSCVLEPRAHDLTEGFTSAGGAGVPPAVVRMMQSRMSRLGPDERRLLRAAAVAGSHFPEVALAGSLGLPLDGVRSTLTDLEVREALVEPDPRDPGMWEFNHPYVWEVVRTTTSAAEARGLADPLAHWWARARPHEVDQVARLFHETGTGEEARSWCLRAMERATRMQAGGAIERYSRWGLEMLGTGPEHARERVVLRIRLGEGLILAGEGSRAVAELRSLLQEDLPEDLRWEARLHLIDALGDAEMSKVDAELDRMEADWPKDTAALPAGVAFYKAVVEANTLMMAGRSKESIEVAQAALASVPKGADPRWVCRLYDSLAWASVSSGELQHGRAAFQKGREVAEEHGLQALAAYHVDGLATIAGREGRPREALELCRTATELSRRAGDLVNTPLHGCKLAVWIHRVEGYAAALPVMRSMAELVERVDLRYVDDRVLGAFGWICLQEDDLVSARRFLLGGTHEPETVGGHQTLERSIGIGELQVREGLSEEGERRLGEVKGDVEANGSPDLLERWHRAIIYATALRQRPELATDSYLALRAALEQVPPERPLRRLDVVDLLLPVARVLNDTPQVLRLLALREELRARVGLPPLAEGPSREGKT